MIANRSVKYYRSVVLDGGRGQVDRRTVALEQHVWHPAGQVSTIEAIIEHDETVFLRCEQWRQVGMQGRVPIIARDTSESRLPRLIPLDLVARSIADAVTREAPEPHVIMCAPITALDTTGQAQQRLINLSTDNGGWRPSLQLAWLNDKTRRFH